MKPLFFFMSALFLISTTSCSVTKRLSPLTDILTQAAASNMNPDQKLEVLVTTVNKALTESLTFVNPKKTVQFINQFSKQNEKSIESILGSLSGSVKDMSMTEKIGFYARTLKKPYVSDLKDTVGKVEKKVGRRIKTFQLVGKLLSFMNPLK